MSYGTAGRTVHLDVGLSVVEDVDDTVGAHDDDGLVVGVAHMQHGRRDRRVRLDEEKQRTGGTRGKLR